MNKERLIPDLQAVRILQDVYAEMILDEQEDAKARKKALNALNKMFEIEKKLMKG